MIRFGKPLRGRLLLERGTAFLNHGSFGTTPRTVLAAAGRWRRRMEANPDRFMREILPAALRGAASRLAAFLKARERDLVFVENATSGMNAVLRSLHLRPGDEILVTSHVYNAVRQTIHEVCKRTGASLIEARIALPVSDVDSLIVPIEKKLGKRTALLVLDHIASPTGLVFPVKRLAALARTRGVRTLVDGAHAPGQIALDIPSLGVDWYTGNCHKWLFAPKGCAFLWTRRGAQDGLHPTVISHGYGRGYRAEFDWVGTRDFSSWLAVPEALDFFRRLGPVRARSYNHKLATQKAIEISKAWNTAVDGPPQLHGSMMAIRLPKGLQQRNPAQLMTELLARLRTVVAVNRVDGVLWARISAQGYNTPADYDRLARLAAF